MGAKRVLITGANGFVGAAACRAFRAAGHIVRAALREATRGADVDCERVAVGEISAATDWVDAVRGIDVVVHLAARVHVMRETAAEPQEAFDAVNVDGTERLARVAAANGVRQLVFASSIFVNGTSTGGRPFNEESGAVPQNPYAESKWTAECVLQRVATETGMAVTIIRPPMVYGPRNAGNILRLLRAIDTGLPLPLASVVNLRSMIYVENLADGLVTCAGHVAAKNRVYVISDGAPLSTPDLVRQLTAALGRPARLWPLPPSLLRAAARLVGLAGEADRLTRSLEVDDRRIRTELQWTPPFTTAQGLEKTAQWYRAGVR